MPADANGHFRLVVFFIGQQEFALEIAQVKEIINPRTVTPVPKAPAFVEGVIDLRGAIVPIVDLRRLFGVDNVAITKTTRCVVISVRSRLVGLVVDAVREVLDAHESELRLTEAVGATDKSSYFSGMYRKANRIIMVLDIEQILGSEESISLSGLQGEAVPE